MPDLLVAQPDGSHLLTKRVGRRATITVGRDPRSSVVVPDDRISRHHAVIFEQAGSWYAVDLGSKAGLEGPDGPIVFARIDPEDAWVGLGPVVIWLDGIETVEDRDPMPIQRRSEPVVRTRADFVDREVPGEPEDSPSLLVLCEGVDAAEARPRLLDLAGADRVVIGADPRCDVVVPGGDAAPLTHLIARTGDRWVVVDLDPDPEVGGNRRRKLVPGTRFVAGNTRFTVLPPEAAIPRTSADASDLEDFDVPSLGSIFDLRSDSSGTILPGNAGESGDRD